MSKTASTLSIRLQLPPDEEATAKPKPPEVEYLWDRIIFAAIAAAVIVAAVVAGAWYWFATPQQNLTAEPAIAPVSAAAAPASAPPASANANSVAATAGSNPSPSAAEQAVADANTPEPMALASVTETTTTSPSATTQAEQQALADGSSATAGPAPTGAQTLAASDDAHSPATSGQAGANSTDTPGQNSLPPTAKVEILSDHLAHAQLSTEFENRQPLNEARAVIPMNDDGLVTVYLYTELAGLQGETLYYNWYHDDRRVARVRARPQRELTRAYSSKYIDRHMLGQWHVELSSAGGDALARAEFEVR